MLVADGSKKERSGPAYDARSLPIGEWAMAVWEKWSPVVSMQRVVDDAVERISKATNKRAVCYGLGAALVLICARIEWTITSATHFITDLGDHLDLLLDPPKVVVMQCYAAVQRWRWRRVE